MNDPMLLVVAAAEHPLIDIDWTIGVQFVIFVVTGFVASKLLFRPYLSLRDNRKQGIEGQREEAERFKAEAEARFRDYEQQLASARTRAHQESRKLQAEALLQERKLTKETADKTASFLRENRDTIASEVARAREELRSNTTDLGQKLASRLLGRKVASS